MKIEEAKNTISKLQEFVDLTENFSPVTFEEHVIKEYAILGNVSKVASKLNELGFRIKDRKVISNDVSEVIRKKPTEGDKLHQYVLKFHKNNIRKNPFL